MKPLELIRKRPAWVAPTLAALVIAGALVYQQRSLEQVAESVQHSSTTSQVQILDERLAALEQFKDAELKQPKAVTLEQLNRLKTVLEDRLRELEAHVVDLAPSRELQALQDAVTALSASMPKVEAEKPAQRPVKRPASTPTPKAPPFTVQGIEVRGGQRFVAVSPFDSTSPEHVRLLRIGDQHLGWRLDDIEPQAVVFRVGVQLRRLEVR